MKGFSSKRIALIIDVFKGPEDILFTGTSVHPSSPEILQAGAVKGLRLQASPGQAAISYEEHNTTGKDLQISVRQDLLFKALS